MDALSSRAWHLGRFDDAELAILGQPPLSALLRGADGLTSVELEAAYASLVARIGLADQNSGPSQVVAVRSTTLAVRIGRNPDSTLALLAQRLDGGPSGGEILLQLTHPGGVADLWWMSVERARASLLTLIRFGDYDAAQRNDARDEDFGVTFVHQVLGTGVAAEHRFHAIAQKASGSAVSTGGGVWERVAASAIEDLINAGLG